MARSRRSQAEHDREVRAQARRLEEKGYEVEADVRGFPKPGTFGGFRPDIVARKGQERKIVEVETPDSVDSARDIGQQRAFRGVASRSKNTTFRRIVAE